jgi:cytochrome c-type biogenesis protein CcmH/NrfG
MTDFTGRRRFIQLAGTGAALSLAGCNALQSDGTNATTTDSLQTTDSGSDSSDGARSVTVRVQPDQEELRERQAELQTQLQNGDISRQEAQQESQRIRQELLTAAMETFEGRDDTGLTIESSIDEFGVYLVSGSATALIDTLSYEEVGSLFAAQTFEEAQAQVDAQSGAETTTDSG